MGSGNNIDWDLEITAAFEGLNCCAKILHPWLCGVEKISGYNDEVHLLFKTHVNGLAKGHGTCVSQARFSPASDMAVREVGEFHGRVILILLKIFFLQVFSIGKIYNLICSYTLPQVTMLEYDLTLGELSFDKRGFPKVTIPFWAAEFPGMVL